PRRAHLAARLPVVEGRMGIPAVLGPRPLRHRLARRRALFTRPETRLGAVAGRGGAPALLRSLTGRYRRYCAARIFSACPASFERRHHPPTIRTKIAPRRAANSTP